VRTIGIAGTAKNTGKTTTAVEIIRQSVAAGLCNAVTSIGYDGEDVDNVTGLPKPRYHLPRGTFLATAKSCLQASSVGYRVVEETRIRTILGPIVVVEVTEPGLAVVAGPNRAVDVQHLLGILQGRRVDLTIVDGALNRIVPLICTEGLVLCTGAALNGQDRVAHVVAHTQALYTLFLPALADDRAAWSSVITLTSGESALELMTGSLLDEHTVLQIQRLLQMQRLLKGAVRDLVIPGACDCGLLQRLLDSGIGNLKSARLIFGSPLKLMASGDALAWSRFLTDAQSRGQVVEYLAKIPLLFVSLNPFYPRFLPKLKAYEPASVDKEQLLAEVRSRIPGLPVFDIKQPPTPNLLALLA
jgi:hypothetical protein